MNDKIKDILEQPTQNKVGILIGANAVILVLFWFLFYSSVGDEASNLEQEVEQLQISVTEKQGIIQNLEVYEEEVKQLEIELAKAEKDLPDKNEIALLLSRVSDKARDAGLKINLFQPVDEVKKDFYAEVPVSIEVEGEFHQVATFFDEVGHMDRLVNLSGFSLKEPAVDQDFVLLKTAVTAKAFRFLDPSERPKKEDGKDGKKKPAKGKGNKDE